MWKTDLRTLQSRVVTMRQKVPDHATPNHATLASGHETSTGAWLTLYVGLKGKDRLWHA